MREKSVGQVWLRTLFRRLSMLNRVRQRTDLLKVCQENAAEAGELQEREHGTQSGT